MKLRIAIIATCAATFALAQVIPAQAQHGNGNRQLVNTTRSNIKHQSEAAPKGSSTTAGNKLESDTPRTTAQRTKAGAHDAGTALGGPSTTR